MRELLRKEDSKQMKQQQCSNKEQEKNSSTMSSTFAYMWSHYWCNPLSRTGLGKLKRSATELMQEALSKSLKSAGLQMKVRLDPIGKQEKSCFSFIFLCLHHFGA